METSKTLLTQSKPDSAQSLAIASVIMGCLGIISLGALLGIPAVICGHMALSRIRGDTSAIKNRRLALGGLVTGYIGIAMTIIMIIGVLTIFLGWLPPEYLKMR
jgi:hypothetical protein